LLSIIIINSNVTALSEKRYTQPTGSLSGNFSGHIRQTDAGLTKTGNKPRRVQTVAAATTPAATKTAATTPAATKTAATTPAATKTAATTPAAATIPIKPKASVSALPGASQVSGPSPICAVSSFVGGKTTSRPAPNREGMCSYNPNTTCCTGDSFENMRQWWEETPSGGTESRSGRYHRRIKEAIRYTKYLIKWNQSVFTIAEQNQAAKSADPECADAAKQFKRIRLPENLLNTYSHYAELCIAHLVGYTNAVICATCDPVGSSFMDGIKNTISLEKAEA
jgi:hypothetical protein